jgi:hypothetical protein
MLNDARGVPVRPRLIWVGLDVLLVERHEHPHDLTAHGLSREELRKLGKPDEPVRVPRRPVRVLAVDDAIDGVVSLAGLTQ